MKKLFISLLFVLSACVNPKPTSVVRPELLISSSDEKISFPISDAGSVSAIEKWISSEDRPSEANVACKDGAKSCNNVKSILKKHKISYTEQATDSEDGSSLTIVYNHVAARDCAASSFGCSTSLNSVKMVTNRQQFIKPSLSDPQDAARAVRALYKNIR